MLKLSTEDAQMFITDSSLLQHYTSRATHSPLKAEAAVAYGDIYVDGEVVGSISDGAA